MEGNVSVSLVTFTPLQAFQWIHEAHQLNWYTTSHRRMPPIRTPAIARAPTSPRPRHTSRHWRSPSQAELARVLKAGVCLKASFRRGKSEAGLDASQVHTWEGEHHHMVLALIAVWWFIGATHRIWHRCGAWWRATLDYLGSGVQRWQGLRRVFQR